jgi:Trk K+ transport system NAD-binding subunit
MGDVLFLALRRLRAPLIVLIAVYAISVAGLVAIPGVDGEGRPWRMGIFHAFYVMSYTATTIGFGEIPYAFTDAQRLWVTVSIYLSVVGWAYALGSVFALTQDPVFRAAAARSLFDRRVAALGEPFAVVCGYGQSGQAIARALDALGVRLVIVDVDPARVAPVAVQPYAVGPLVLAADARRPEVLRSAGIAKPECRAVVAVTGDDDANQAIAIGARVLDLATQVIARASDPVVQANLAEFGGVQVIDPFRSFAQNVGVDFAAPAALQLEEWLTGVPGAPRPEPVRLPRGHWILAGYGRFGRLLAAALGAAGQPWQAFDPTFAPPDEADDRVHACGGTEEGLRDCGIERAVGVIAGTDNDTINVAVAALARRLRPGVSLIVRRNRAYNQALIDSVAARLIFVQSEVMLHEVVQALTTPLLERLLERARAEPALADALCAALAEVVGDRVPQVWTFDCDPAQPGMRQALSDPTRPLRLGELLVDPSDPSRPLAVLPLLVSRAPAPAVDATAVASAPAGAAGWLHQVLRARPGGARQAVWSIGGRTSEEGIEILPDRMLGLRAHDRILFAGGDGEQSAQRRFLLDPTPIDFVRTGREPPRSWLFRRFSGRAR